MNKTNNTICFIVCPKAANTTFIKELEQKLKQPYSIYTTDNKNINKGARYMIFNYSNLDDMIRYLYAITEKGYKVFSIFDEVHIMQSSASNQSKKLRAIRDKFTCVIGLTATPL